MATCQASPGVSATRDRSRGCVVDLEEAPVLGELVARGQTGLPSSDHAHVQRWPVRAGGLHRTGSGLRVTLKLNIIPLSVCSAMWQWAIHSPGLVTCSKMSMVSPAFRSTVSFHTRLGSR